MSPRTLPALPRMHIRIARYPFDWSTSGLLEAPVAQDPAQNGSQELLAGSGDDLESMLAAWFPGWMPYDQDKHTESRRF